MDTYPEPAEGSARETDRVLDLLDNALADPEAGTSAMRLRPDGAGGVGSRQPQGPPDTGTGDPGTDDSGHEDEPVRAARHCSTGKLTSNQRRIVNAWRRQLLESDMKWHTPNHRPPASSSDCIAAAVLDLLKNAEPDHLTLIRYATRIRDQLEEERTQQFPMSSAVSFYLPPAHADRAESLLLAARTHHVELLHQARSAASAERARTKSTIGALSIPGKVYQLPIGTLARMGIERWARRSPTTVVADAVRHGDLHHAQQHRARRDMGTGEVQR
ncbi:hypothetical protein [Nocardia fluminea]|uniref:hypothetical protein n=1 Tax=Nocardia fluminea TaxID=134984 RepID=UPI003D14CF06